MINFTTVLYPLLLTLLTGFLGYLGKEVLKIVPKIIDYTIEKIGLTNYQKMKLIGLDVWNETEEYFRLNPVIGDTIQAKITTYKTSIKQKIPGITDANIELVRQAIAGEVNKDKPLVVKELSPEIQKTTPIIKYFSADGITELTPVVAKVEVTNTTSDVATGTDINPIDGQPIA